MGAYVGVGTAVVAKGVPDRFRDKDAVREVEGLVEKKVEEGEKVEGCKEGVSLGRALREGLAVVGGSGSENGNGEGGSGSGTAGGLATWKM